MKRNRLLLLLALLMMAATGAWAQQTLTVYDGTFEENYSPANICYSDEFTRSQTVIPSTALTAMKGCDITAMKFYSNNIAASGTIDYSFDVYLKEVSYTAFDESSPTFEPKSSCTTVHQGKLSISNFELTITFSKPFHYNGGNLLLGMENNSIVTYYEIRFLGTNTGSSLSNISIHHATDLASATSITKRYFIPKTTFTYVVPTYSVKLADGTQDAANWTIASGENSATGDAADGLTGLKEGDAVTLTYGGRMKVKGVTATTDAAPAANIVDLSTLTADYVAQDGDVLTNATTTHKVEIAAGATVTLDGVNISSSSYCIKCAGEATIILKDGSTNTLTGTGDEYPALSIGDANTTLTIQGSTGVLNVTSGEYCAGIGGGYMNTNCTCGNITIEGGVITAQGGSYGSGIGTDCGTATCGDIIIKGGTITAKGGINAAGIGTGNGFANPVVCGDITIANTVTKVTATKGEGAAHSIGKGYGEGCTCGTVTIGGTVYWQDNAAVNGGDTYLGQATIIYPEP